MILFCKIHIFSFNFPSASDNTVPVISGCPNNIAQTVELGTASAVVSWVEPTATDDSGIVTRIVRTHEPNTAFNVGPTTVTYIFEDGNSNRAVCSFTVTISTGTFLSTLLPLLIPRTCMWSEKIVPQYKTPW